MYSMDDLLLVHSDGADGLKLRVGRPPVVVIDSQNQEIEGAVLTAENAEQLLQSVADTRQRRELRELGEISFMYRFRGRVSFVIRARIQNEKLLIDIH
jgi:Tfp pilus assembly ATPase PilU